MRKFIVTKIADGLGFGHGSISLNDRIDDSEDNLDHETRKIVETSIDSDEILVPVEVKDDGCSDGRGVKRIFHGLIERLKSLNRSKVFGGGATMATAALIGLGKATGTICETFKSAISRLQERKVHFGAHTDDHAKGENGGCGAIDNAPLIIANAEVYKNGITEAIGVLTNGDYNHGQLEEVFDNYNKYSEEVSEKPHSGREVAEVILGSDKVVKELEGPHLETHIVINTVDGYTVNQDYIRRVSKGNAQVFGVDEWRVRELSDKMFDTEPECQQAYLGMLVYTLATAATLTKGDLPVFVVSKHSELVAA